MPAGPSSARRTRPTPDAPQRDDDVESEPSHPSLIEGEDELSPDTDPVVFTLADVRDEQLDMSECVSKILEGLRGDAFSISRDVGLERLLRHDGIDHLVEDIRRTAFPLQSEEASELFRQGQMLNGPLAKQQGETMLSYVARRKQWWSTLRELDPDIRLSEAMRANLLVELSGLDRTEQLMIKTAARSQTVEEYARVLVQHHSVVHMKERLLSSKDNAAHGKAWGKFTRTNEKFPKYGYLGYDPEEHGDDAYGEPASGYGQDGYEAYPATAPEPDDEWLDDEDLAMQLNAYTAVAYEAELDDLDDSFAEPVQLAYAAQTAFSQAKGKGKGKGKGKPGGKSGGKLAKSNLTIADRKAKLAELKAKSRCLKCGVIGHWAGDAACKFSGKGANPKGGTLAQSGSPGIPAAKPAAPKPQAYMAMVEESDAECEVVYLSNQVAGHMEGYPAELKSSPAKSDKSGKGRGGVFSPQLRRTAAASIMRDAPPEGSDAVFAFGQHRGLTYERVVYTYPGYVIWGRPQKCPSLGLANFMEWATNYFDIQDHPGTNQPITVVRRDVPLNCLPPPEPFALEVRLAASSTSTTEGRRKCPGGCKEFSKSGSNAYIDMRTCKKCGTVTKSRKEKDIIDSATCPHTVTERSGSSSKTSRIKCKLCGMLLGEQPQSERKARDAAANALREANTLIF